MDASAFWEVIGNYNLNTGTYQIVLLSLLVAGILASFLSKYKWIAKAVLGVLNLFIALFFFLQYGTEPIQKFFALPLFSASGILFIYETIWHPEGTYLPSVSGSNHSDGLVCRLSACINATWWKIPAIGHTYNALPCRDYFHCRLFLLQEKEPGAANTSDNLGLDGRESADIQRL